jgi:hypothetical protein
MSVEQKQIWIALVSVQPLPDSEILKDASGAHVNVLTWASVSQSPVKAGR